ncbi:Diphthamide biosynthesis protein 2 [Elasticomyces elasticus]|nr:Diphthamide biosynthesis protein 2 [Elasticomyces elasticus]
MEAAPVLSTPDSRILEATDPVTSYESRAVTDDELTITYDIERTLKEIREARYKRVALQFPDDMLGCPAGVPAAQSRVEAGDSGSGSGSEQRDYQR